jgi:hypothetical protein
MNSLHKFLLEINQKKEYFSQKRMLNYDKADVSMPLIEFQKMYSEYCSKHNYVEITNIPIDAKDTLDNFEL